jgi:hypothetical protein
VVIGNGRHRIFKRNTNRERRKLRELQERTIIMIIGGICFILGFFGGTYLAYSWCCNVIAALESEVRRQAELMKSIDGSLWAAK